MSDLSPEQVISNLKETHARLRAEIAETALAVAEERIRGLERCEEIRAGERAVADQERRQLISLLAPEPEPRPDLLASFLEALKAAAPIVKEWLGEKKERREWEPRSPDDPPDFGAWQRDNGGIYREHVDGWRVELRDDGEVCAFTDDTDAVLDEALKALSAVLIGAPIDEKQATGMVDGVLASLGFGLEFGPLGPWMEAERPFEDILGTLWRPDFQGHEELPAPWTVAAIVRNRGSGRPNPLRFAGQRPRPVTPRPPRFLRSVLFTRPDGLSVGWSEGDENWAVTAPVGTIGAVPQCSVLEALAAADERWPYVQQEAPTIEEPAWHHALMEDPPKPGERRDLPEGWTYGLVGVSQPGENGRTAATLEGLAIYRDGETNESVKVVYVPGDGWLTPSKMGVQMPENADPTAVFLTPDFSPPTVASIIGASFPRVVTHLATCNQGRVGPIAIRDCSCCGSLE